MALNEIYTDLELAKRFVNHARSAKDRGIEFNLSFKKFRQLMKAKRCYYTGIIFEKDTQDQNKLRSIDRVDSSIGYIDSNVVVCTAQINSFKSNLSYTQIVGLADMLKKFRVIKTNGGRREIKRIEKPIIHKKKKKV